MNGSMMLFKMRLIFMASQVQVVLGKVKFWMLWNVIGVQMKWMMGWTRWVVGYPLGL